MAPSPAGLWVTAGGKVVCLPTSPGLGRLAQFPPACACSLCAGREAWGAGRAEPDLGLDSERPGLILMGLPPIRRKGKRRQELLRASGCQLHGVFIYPHGLESLFARQFRVRM